MNFDFSKLPKWWPVALVAGIIVLGVLFGG